MNLRSYLLLLISYMLFTSVCNGQAGIVSTYIALPGTDAPSAMVMDTAGNIYYTSNSSNKIKKISTSGLITTIAGTGTAGYSGDGGPATDAQLNGNTGMCIDRMGNIILSDVGNGVIRKITASTGIISTIAGINGIPPLTSGDGGPATDATLETIYGIASDTAGNIYLADNTASVIRKIDAAGIISTIAGLPTLDIGGFGGDGGPASAASLLSPANVSVDSFGNIYIEDEGNVRLRKIDASGTITTIAGDGTAGYSGDGGPATAADLPALFCPLINSRGDVYVSDGNDATIPASGIRRVGASGIISTVAGNNTRGYSGDGGPAVLAAFSTPYAGVFDKHNNLYVADLNNYVVRKISFTPDVAADSFSIFYNNICSGIDLSAMTNSAAATAVITYFGDGTADTSALLPASPGKYAHVSHNYGTSGAFTVKEVLKNGTVTLDSAHFSYNYLFCRTFDVRFYLDADGSCSRDSSELFNYFPLLVEVDSNGIAIDTLAATSGIYYNAYGVPGDIYNFKVLSAPAGLAFTCSGSGIVADTLSAISYNVVTKYLGFICTSSTDFDLVENVNMQAGMHLASGTITVDNTYCTAQDATVTMNINPKYIFQSSVPAPSAVVGNTVSWDITALSAITGATTISYTLTVPGAWLSPGDTVMSSFVLTPIAGDMDPSSNTITRVDTVKGSYDPNEISVIPGGYILPGTFLQYTIGFENTGNDTAFNIAVLDTLSDNVDPMSLRIDATSATMNTALYHAAGHNIIKFDFPHIKLLDSSHHDRCTGMIIFHVQPKAGLADGATIFNHAGIFFDDNSVVTTDTAENIISFLHGLDSICAGSQLVLSAAPAGGVWTRSNTSVTTSADTIRGIATGIDTLTYTTTTRYGSTSITKIVTVNSLPSSITGAGAVCTDSSTSLSDATAAGNWSTSAATIATINSATGAITGIAAGTVTITYTAPTGCIATKGVTVNPTPLPVSGALALCSGAASSLSDVVGGGTWSSANTAVASIGSTTGVLSGVSAGVATITYTAAGCSISSAITVNPLPAPISGVSALCAGNTTGLSDLTADGTWSSSTPGIAMVETIGASTGVVIGIAPGVDTIHYIAPTGCEAHNVVTVYAVPAVAVAATAADCGGTHNLASSGALSYTWSPAAGVSCATCASTVVNPVVATIYTVTGTGTHGCSATATVSISANRIAGHVTASGSPTDIIRVWLMQINPADSSLIAQDSMLTCIDGGTPYYQFDNMPAGSYLVRAVLTTSVPGVTGYAPTYGAATPYWDAATGINHSTATDTLHISLIHGTVPAGAGAVSGSVFSATGSPVAGMLVYLLNSSGQVVTYVYTGASGAYSFSGLAEGVYIVYPEDYKYYTTASAPVNVSAASETVSDINFRQYVAPSIIMPYSNVMVSTPTVGAAISIYPNPASGGLNVRWSQQMPGNAEITISDMLGKTVYTSALKISMTSGKSLLDISGLREGVYVITITSGGTLFNCKLVIE